LFLLSMPSIEVKMDKIILKDMEFMGLTGCLPEEKVNPQPFIITVEMFFENIKGTLTDNLDDTVNYALVFDAVKDVVENRSFNLIERMAQVIADESLGISKAKKVIVKVSKPKAPIEGTFDSMEVEIERYG